MDWVTQLKNISAFFQDISRQYHHQAAWNMIVKNPWFGVGINTFDINYHLYRAAGDTITRWSAHHAYLQMMAETGIMGFASFTLFIFFMVRKNIQTYIAQNDSQIKNWIGGLGLGFLAFMVTGFFESNLWQPRQTSFFWFWSGIWCAMCQLRIEKKI